MAGLDDLYSQMNPTGFSIMGMADMLAKNPDQVAQMFAQAGVPPPAPGTAFGQDSPLAPGPTPPPTPTGPAAAPPPSVPFGVPRGPQPSNPTVDWQGEPVRKNYITGGALPPPSNTPMPNLLSRALGAPAAGPDMSFAGVPGNPTDGLPSAVPQGGGAPAPGVPLPQARPDMSSLVGGGLGMNVPLPRPRPDSAPAATPGAARGTQRALQGVKAPEAPAFQRISSPRAPTPHGQIKTGELVALMQSLMGRATPPDMLRLAQTLKGLG